MYKFINQNKNFSREFIFLGRCGAIVKLCVYYFVITKKNFINLSNYIIFT